MLLNPELEDRFGARVDLAVAQIGAMQGGEPEKFRESLRELVADAYAAGAVQMVTLDAQTRQSF